MLEKIKQKLSQLSEEELKEVTLKENYYSDEKHAYFLITETKAKIKVEKLKEEEKKYIRIIAKFNEIIIGRNKENLSIEVALKNLLDHLNKFNSIKKSILIYSDKLSHHYANNFWNVKQHLTLNDFYYRADKGYKCFAITLDDNITYMMGRDKEEIKNQFDDFDKVEEISYQEFYDIFNFD